MIPTLAFVGFWHKRVFRSKPSSCFHCALATMDDLVTLAADVVTPLQARPGYSRSNTDELTLHSFASQWGKLPAPFNTPAMFVGIHPAEMQENDGVEKLPSMTPNNCEFRFCFIKSDNPEETKRMSEQGWPVAPLDAIRCNPFTTGRQLTRHTIVKYLQKAYLENNHCWAHEGAKLSLHPSASNVMTHFTFDRICPWMASYKIMSAIFKLDPNAKQSKQKMFTASETKIWDQIVQGHTDHRPVGQTLLEFSLYPKPIPGPSQGHQGPKPPTHPTNPT